MLTEIGRSSTDENQDVQEEVQAEESPTSIEVNADALRQLQDMGFTEGRAKKALLLNRSASHCLHLLSP